MNNPLFKIQAFSMALLVLFSTFSYSIEKHMCGTMVVDTAIFSHAKRCGSEAKVCGEMEAGMVGVEGSCCSNKRTTIEGQDELKISLDSWDFEQQLFFTSLTFSYIFLNEDLRVKEIPFEHYSPPILITDIQVLDQVFLI